MKKCAMTMKNILMDIKYPFGHSISLWILGYQPRMKKNMKTLYKYLNPQPNIEMEFGKEKCAIPMINIALDIKYPFGY